LPTAMSAHSCCPAGLRKPGASPSSCASRQSIPGRSAQLISTAVAGRAALASGRLRTHLRSWDRWSDDLTASGETNGFDYRYRLPRLHSRCAV
jgi:hypothetical protein